MATCAHCGAPIVLSHVAITPCGFCGVDNAPERPRAAAPVQVVHRVVQVAAGAAEASDLGRCPHCRRPFASVAVEGVTLHGCAGCGGIWVDNDSARTMLDNPLAVFEQLSNRAAENARTTRPRNPRPPCPQCACVLEQRRFHGVDIDVCPEHGTWFDALELAALVGVVREAKRVLARDASGGSIACAACKEVVLRSKTSITPLGAVCDGCFSEWQRRQANLIAGDAQPTESVLLGLHRALYQQP